MEVTSGQNFEKVEKKNLRSKTLELTHSAYITVSCVFYPCLATVKVWRNFTGMKVTSGQNFEKVNRKD